MSHVRVIGAGPAGLMAAEVLARAGVAVRVADRMPSVGRKFLMAGKSGLNLTKAEPDAEFVAHYSGLPAGIVTGPRDVIAWAEGLDQPLFTGSTGRVFPVAMKASPLLRAWLARLAALGVAFDLRWRWTGWAGDALRFEGPQGAVDETPAATVLALGGASWRRLGSDGAWAGWVPGCAPFRPANCGFAVDWSPHMARVFGQPVKAAALHAGGAVSRGEWVVTARGIEGGGVYEVAAAVRDGAPLHVDLLADLAPDQLAARLARRRSAASLPQVLKSVLKLPPVKAALYQELSRRSAVPGDLATALKALPIPHNGPLPLDEAISTAGGLRFDALTPDLMLRARPGVFAAGEMLDWEAPTGGYLLTGCLATGERAAEAALRFLRPG